MYRKAHSSASMAWLRAILNKHVPFLVCLTFGDKLFAECMPSRQSHLDPPDQSKLNDSSIDEKVQEHKKVSNNNLKFIYSLYTAFFHCWPEVA